MCRLIELTALVYLVILVILTPSDFGKLCVRNRRACCSSPQDFMRQAGEVTYADAHKERTNEGVIEFRSYSDMKRAIDKLDGTDINGRKIRLVEDKPRRRRSYSGSRSRSGLHLQLHLSHVFM